MKYVLVLVVAVSLSFALIPWSFRYQSTANLWEDDYDLLFDPARIPEIEGSRLYTSLSNFVSGYENLFSSDALPFYMIGGSTYFSGIYPGLSYDRTKAKSEEWTGLVDVNGDNIFGEGSVSTIDWLDLDDDGDIDYQVEETTTALAYDAVADADYFVGFGIKSGNMRYGIGLLRGVYENTVTDPENNFTYEYIENNIENDSLEQWDTEFASGDNVYGETGNDILLSFWYDSDNWSFGLRTGYGMFSWTEQEVVLSGSESYDVPEDMTDNYAIVDALDSLDLPQSGTRIPIFLTLFYNYNENAQGRFYLGYEMESWSYDDGAMDFFGSSSDANYFDQTLMYDTTIALYSGEGNENTITIGTKHLWKVNPRLNFGMGVLVGMTSGSDSTLYDQTNTSILDYDDGDTISNELDDYTSTTTSAETWITTSETSGKTFSFPVGLEVFFSNPFCLRLGAIYTLAFNKTTTHNEQVAFEPEVTTIQYGDGSEATTYQDDGEIPVDEEIVDVSDSYTNYMFGLGWRINKNLQLDFMGFTELFDMTDWRLSATMILD